MATHRKWATTRSPLDKACDAVLAELSQRIDSELSARAIDGIASTLDVPINDVRRGVIVGMLIAMGKQLAPTENEPTEKELRREVDRIGAAAAEFAAAVEGASPAARAIVALNCNPGLADKNWFPVFPNVDVAVTVREGARLALDVVRQDAAVLGISVRRAGRPRDTSRVLRIFGLAILFERITGERATQGKRFRSFVRVALEHLEPKAAIENADRSLRRALRLADENRPATGWVLPADAPP